MQKKPSQSVEAMEMISKILDDDSRVARNDTHAWEQALDKTWDRIEEGQDGLLAELPSLVNTLASKRITDNQVIESRGIREGVIRKGLIRALCVCLDLTESSLEKDMRPTRGDVMTDCIKQFIGTYFDQNPVCTMSVLACSNSKTHTLTPLGGSPHTHIQLVSEGVDAGGQLSLESVLHTSVSILGSSPPHCSREILLITSSFSTLDHYDIEETIKLCQQLRVKVSIVGYGARVYVFDKVCSLTGGRYTVADNVDRLRDLVMSHVAPLPTLKDSIATSQPNQSSLVLMGFPALSTQSNKPCACHLTPQTEGYVCPQCKTIVCQLPCQCPVCSTTLVSAPHLARSYHHLFHVPISEPCSSERYKLIVKDDESKPRNEPISKGILQTEITEHDALETCARVICAGCDVSLILPPEKALLWADEVLHIEEQQKRFKNNITYHPNVRRQVEMDFNTIASVPDEGSWWKHTQLGCICTLCHCIVCVDCDKIIHTSLHNCPGCLSQ